MWLTEICLEIISPQACRTHRHRRVASDSFMVHCSSSFHGNTVSQSFSNRVWAWTFHVNCLWGEEAIQYLLIWQPWVYVLKVIDKNAFIHKTDISCVAFQAHHLWPFWYLFSALKKIFSLMNHFFMNWGSKVAINYTWKPEKWDH